jgi:hypothetical protein
MVCVRITHHNTKCWMEQLVSKIISVTWMKKRKQEPNKHFRQWSSWSYRSLWSSPHNSSPHPWRWRHCVPSKWWYTIIRLAVVTNYKTSIKTHITMETSYATTKQYVFRFSATRRWQQCYTHLYQYMGSCVKHKNISQTLTQYNPRKLSVQNLSCGKVTKPF